MMDDTAQSAVLETVYARAKVANAKIGLADTEDERITQAMKQIEDRGLPQPILITPDFFSKLPADEQNRLVELVCGARASRGKPISPKEVRDALAGNTVYLAAAMVKAGSLDGYVAGNISKTEDVLRPALQIIGAKKFASSFFLMLFPEDRPMLFADCAFNAAPDPDQLATIAVDTAHSARAIGIEPRVAFLSFSTAGSAKHEIVQKVQAAIASARARSPELKICEHELQYDTAINLAVAEKKMGSSDVAGFANVLIFPDLNSGNIGYKIANQLGVRAVGPIMQGLNAPANDLSRGCSVQDIVDVVAITAMQAGDRAAKKASD